MHVVRYNPVFRQWVLVGPQQLSIPSELPASVLLDGGKSGAQFVAAHLPHQPLVFDPEEVTLSAEVGQVYASQAPVGEYELLLYRGQHDLFAWDAAHWSAWLELVQQRTRAMHHNTHLHHVHVQLHTGLRTSITGYQRVGDLVATSQQLAGMSTLITDEEATKLHERERTFEVHHDGFAHVLVPSAPLHANELWIIPQRHHPSMESIGADERTGLAMLLATLMPHLAHEFQGHDWMIRLHGGFATHSPHESWWMQLYTTDGTESPALNVRSLPEYLVKKFHSRTILS
jgi:hypothetical protein